MGAGLRNMKLRIYRNSMRFRLSPSDVAALRRTAALVETTRFGPAIEYSYGLYLRSGIAAMRATLDSNRIRVEIPALLAENWAESDTVGLRHAQDIGSGKTLEILVEKDFECLEAQMNEAGETFYPNPNKACPANAQTL